MRMQNTICPKDNADVICYGRFVACVRFTPATQTTTARCGESREPDVRQHTWPANQTN